MFYAQVYHDEQRLLTMYNIDHPIEAYDASLQRHTGISGISMLRRLLIAPMATSVTSVRHFIITPGHTRPQTKLSEQGLLPPLNVYAEACLELIDLSPFGVALIDANQTAHF